VRYIIAILFLITACHANVLAQQDSLSFNKSSRPVKTDSTQGYVSKIRSKLQSVTTHLNPDQHLNKDTLKLSRQQKLDSLKSRTIAHRLDSIKAFDVANGVDQKSDSLQNLVTKPISGVTDKVSATDQKIYHVTDSLQSIPEGLKNNFALPGLSHKADSLQEQIKSIDTKLSGAEQKVQNKVDSLQNKLTAPLTKIQDRVGDEIIKVNKEGLQIPGTEQLKVPGIDMPGAEIKGIDLPESSLPGMDTKLPGLNAGQSLGKDLPAVGDVKVPDGLPDVKEGLTGMDLPATDELGKINDLSGEAGKLDGQLGELDKYEGDIKNLKDGADLEKLDVEAEEQLNRVHQLKGLNAEMDKAKQMQAQQTALLQRYRDKKLLQEEITRKASNVANDYLGQHTAAVKSAQAQLAKSKKGLSAIKNVKDVFKKKSDELDGKKFYQRLVPGVTLQMHNNKVFNVDLATQIGYRLTPRFTAGVGFTYRAAINDKFKYLVSSEGVYGTRTYFDFAALKGIYVHGEFEYLKLNPKKFSQPLTQEPDRTTVCASYFGLGKKFNISRKIKGSIVGLYRVEYSGSLPTMNKLNVRLGFDYVIRKYKKL
jgi:hypothetical protein